MSTAARAHAAFKDISYVVPGLWIDLDSKSERQFSASSSMLRVGTQELACARNTRAVPAFEGLLSVPVQVTNMLWPSLLRALRAMTAVLVGAALLGASPLPAMAADGEAARASVARAKQETAAVEVDGRVLFRLRGVSSMPADERAANVAERIKALARTPTFAPR